MKYDYTRVCKCGKTELIEVEKRDATFGLKEREIFKLKCSKCGSSEFSSLSQPQAEFDKELLLEWGNNPEFLFMEQDEDLILADESNIELILDVLDNHKVLEQKRKVLIGALCVIIYDNVESKNGNADLVNRVADILIKRKKEVLIANDWIMDYIKVLVFPIIGIEMN